MIIAISTANRVAFLNATALAATALLLAVYTNGTALYLLPVFVVVFASVYGCVYISVRLIFYKRLSVLRQMLIASLFAPSGPGRITSGPNANDLDELVELTKQVQLLNRDEFKRLNKSESFRKEFIGDISHELKTPIFTIQGYLETLADGAIDDSTVNKKFLKKAQNNVARLISLTQDLTEISRLETGEQKPRKQIVALIAVIRDVMESLSDMALKHRVKLLFKSDHQQIFVLADRNQIRQVLFNLAENAIKYNKPSGNVRIELHVDGHSSNKILVSVIDSGIGINASDLGRITERFFRVDKSRSRDQGGTGLGLSIVKHIIESHNERLIVESVPGNGSRFSFTLDMAERSLS